MITQYFIPEIFKHFHEEGFLLNGLLKPYVDVNAPTFFYSTQCLEHVILKHKGPAVMIINNDIRPIQNNLEWVKNKKDFYFISTSKLISIYLDNLGLNYVEFPWNVSNTKNVQSYPKGKSVYFYGSSKGDNFYGYHILPRLIKDNFPHLNVIYTRYSSSIPPFINYTKDQLKEVYKKVFVGVRLTRFDGLSDTVQSLGIRGIKTIWNGGTPSALSYKNEHDIINHIRNEEKTIGFNDTALASKCKEYLNMTNPDYNYVFQLETYSQNKPTPKLFHNDQPLTFKNYKETIAESSNMSRPLSI